MLPRSRKLEWLSTCVLFSSSLLLQLGCGTTAREFSSSQPSLSPSGTASTSLATGAGGSSSSGPAQPNIPGSDNATSAPQTGSGLSVTPADLPNFGIIPDGTSSAPQTGTLTAVGSSLTLTSISLVQAGGGGNAFSVTGLPSLPFTLAAGSTQNFSVIFTPALDHPGLASGTLTFTSNANKASQTLSGAGSSIVQLWWIASATPGVTYNVYRCAGSNVECQISFLSFAQIEAADADTTYSDVSVVSGQTYYYFVTAVDGQGIESVPSPLSDPAVIP